ncbi:argininosuccinate lyase [Alteromonas sp. 5E99-2]|uniref:argininosuccinate lyase n=1 Tax=Alteromonas sp. 5E99-2 TaxID=2817683 RepID=UPI001A98AEB1|nr:argininosuccinate lyase [Alteromonas sp. 5E99-2]MBO1254626.1 argininosuccinate lyase [Alteromonas sp. 5E99-2]
MALWGGRFSQGSSGLFRQVNDSLPFDNVMAVDDMTGSIVWSRALLSVNVLTADEQKQLEDTLTDMIAQVENGQLDVSTVDEEDIHSVVEALLTEKLGDIGRKLHTGRSRNDQVATDFRLWCRRHAEELLEDLNHLTKSLLNCASKYQQAILPGYTHLQRAQPVLWPHWCLAYVEMFNRDISRLTDAIKRLNQCPLGSGALAGTTYPVDRHQIASDLGFDGPCLNSLDAVSDRDFVLDLLYCASTSMMHMSRMAEDLIFYNTGEAGFMQLGDTVTSGSSLMPQKKNPDALELMRGKCGRVFGHLQGMLVTLKGLPLAYNKDMQEDKEGVMDAVTQWHICLRIAADVLDSAKLNTERCKEAAQQGYSNATELADYLVEKGIPFRTAHDITGQLVMLAIEKSCALEALPLADMQSVNSNIGDDVYAVLDINYGISKRNALGGTSQETVNQALDAALKAQAK